MFKSIKIEDNTYKQGQPGEAMSETAHKRLKLSCEYMKSKIQFLNINDIRMNVFSSYFLPSKDG